MKFEKESKRKKIHAASTYRVHVSKKSKSKTYKKEKRDVNKRFFKRNLEKKIKEKVTYRVQEVQVRKSKPTKRRKNLPRLKNKQYSTKIKVGGVFHTLKNYYLYTDHMMCVSHTSVY